MSIGKAMIIHLIVELIKKTLHKSESILSSEILEEILMSKLICLIMQQKQLSKIFHKLILQVLH